MEAVVGSMYSFPFNINLSCSSDPYFWIKNGDNIFKYEEFSRVVHFKGAKKITLSLPEPFAVTGDLKVMFFDEDRFSKNDKMFHFWLNTRFIYGGNGKASSILLSKHELDGAVKDKKCKFFDRDFGVEVHFVCV